MVCLGNICRSPIAEGLMKKHCQQQKLNWQIDSAGTIGFHAGEPPDVRSICCCKKHGVDISMQRASKIELQLLDTYDFIFTMDNQNLADIKNTTAIKLHHLFAILPFAEMTTSHVPDPYYGNTEDFDYVFQLLDEACIRVINKILNK